MTLDRIRFLFSPKPRLVWVHPSPPKDGRRSGLNLSDAAHNGCLPDARDRVGMGLQVLCVTFKSRVEALRRI